LITGYFVICIIGAVALILDPSKSKDYREGFTEGAEGSKGSKGSKEDENNDENKKDDKK
jgi:hypothetical protein